MDFYSLKINIIEATGLERDALHIYVGIAAYLVSLMILRPIFKTQSTRQLIALIIATGVAIAGEVLDIRYNIRTGIGVRWGESIHDILNTCFWPYALYALMRWTRIFHPTNQSRSVTRRKQKTDY
ncbi:hypothetical protein [Psychrobacter aquaticus]|uniref:hypothetical protein n=1 Tax=Psychrobacter aquaticus TaxID=248452 RepID=UPI00058CB76D|nr:hypothetical protein [Psychrobacter aquaticus]